MALKDNVMNKQTLNSLASIFFILFGFWISFYSKRHAAQITAFYYKLFHIRFSETIYRWFFLMGGIALSTFGLLALIGVIRFK